MQYLKLVEDTLYWLKTQDNTFIFSNESFSMEKPVRAPLEKKATSLLPPKVEPQKAAISPKPLSEKPSITSKPTSKPQVVKTYTPPPVQKYIPPLEITQFLQKNAVKLMSAPLADTLGKRYAKAYQYKNQAADITILSLQSSEKDRLFLTAIAKAIETYFFPCRIIWETDGMDWASFLSASHLKLIIACDYSIWQEKKLMQFFRENPTNSSRFLQDTPLFLLPDLSLYYKDPLLKRSLWKTLCQKIQTL